MSKTEMHKFNTIIIGTGAAGYAAADALRRHGVTDIAIVTNGKNCGTSRNIGSDKQTYYKPSQDGQTEDSAAALAWDYMDGGCCDGVLAYVEGANSMRCFYRLLELGVYFPQDKYGAFPSYKTDHDRGGRATSIGPLTSKSMVECLEKQVLERDKTPIFDDMQVVKILRKKDRVYGIAALCKGKTLVSIFAKNVIFATGAPANIYAQSVYPQSQRGATGVLIDAGVKLVNFCEWQYGLASLKFRWNLSGTYLQVMPHIYSEDEQGKKYDFIYDALGANGIAAVFRKGSQWPFDAAKIDGTSRLDMLIHAETSAKRRVFLDYRRNPTGYDFKALPKDVRDYLQERESVFDTPIGRMERLNPKAIELYMSKGIDLYSEPLEAAICAQHNNGGVLVDEHCRTNLEGLYVIGEAAGIFGLTRPGGSALNSTQVTALRAARAIAGDAASGDDDLPTTDEDFADVIKELQTQISTVKIDPFTAPSKIPTRMSDCAGFLRRHEDIVKLLEDVRKNMTDLAPIAQNLSEYFYERDMLRSSLAMLVSIIATMEKTGSRGGALYIRNGAVQPENILYRSKRAVTNIAAGVEFIDTRPIPKESTVFEKVYK